MQSAERLRLLQQRDDGDQASGESSVIGSRRSGAGRFEQGAHALFSDTSPMSALPTARAPVPIASRATLVSAAPDPGPTWSRARASSAAFRAAADHSRSMAVASEPRNAAPGVRLNSARRRLSPLGTCADSCAAMAASSASVQAVATTRGDDQLRPARRPRRRRPGIALDAPGPVRPDRHHSGARTRATIRRPLASSATISIAASMASRRKPRRGAP